MSHNPQTLNKLLPIAKDLRERQIFIEEKSSKVMAIIGEILSEIREQGRDIINAKTHLGRITGFAEWLKDNVPNLPIKTSSKYERITIEGITDIRQAVFAFMPEPDRRPLVHRTKPEEWELSWACLTRFVRTTKDISHWPHEQIRLTQQDITPTIEVLGGKVTWLH